MTSWNETNNCKHVRTCFKETAEIKKNIKNNTTKMPLSAKAFMESLYFILFFGIVLFLKSLSS